MTRPGSRIYRAALLLASCMLISSAPLAAQGGASLFKSRCAGCHGTDGSGNTSIGKSMKLRDFASEDVQKLSNAELTSIITNGKGAMPSYKDKLTAAEIRDLVTFIRTLKKKG